MRILRVKASNFGSYPNIDFDFDNQGLTLISGPTGAGKSTLMDVVPWALFGRTSKNGTVDEIMSWPCDKVTSAVVSLGDVTVSRSRGPSSKDNDLMFWPVDGQPVRGKDITDTQKLLNAFLGIDAELYLSAAYFHEFSQTASFFTATAKNRRLLTEQLVDLTLAKKINKDLAEYKKELKNAKDLLVGQIAISINNIKHTEDKLKTEQQKSKAWKQSQEIRLTKLVALNDNFKADQAKSVTSVLERSQLTLLELSKDMADLRDDLKSDTYFTSKSSIINARKAKLKEVHCTECGVPKDTEKRLLITKDEYALQRELELNQQRRSQIDQTTARIKRLDDTTVRDINQENSRHNPYPSQIETITLETNPHNTHVHSTALAAETAVLLSLTDKNSVLSVELADIQLLQQVIEDFRLTLVKNTIVHIEHTTNKLLADHFDAELRVSFEIEDAEKLDVQIYKDGNSATFTQLSKGQRHLLKLTFGVAVMKAVSNHSGVSFNAVFLDEVAEGLDEDMKVKIYGLLQGLSLDHSTVLAIDHSEALKALFTNRYNVTLSNGASTIEKAN